MMNNFFLRGLSHQNKSNGFTLVELMVAILITSIVVSVTGWGVVALTQKNKVQKAETERRVELNRALDFIADEVRQAKPIATDASANLSTIAPDFSLTFDTPVKTRIPVLTLQIPGVSQRVIYYIAPKRSDAPWLGPNVVYRWGPNFYSNGTYSNPNTPANWTYEPLTDLIVDTPLTTTPSCSGTLNPPSGITGFYACVDPSGRIADIHLRGKLTDAYGNSREPLEVSSKVTARPYNAPFLLGSSTAPSSGSGGTVTITQPSTAYFEVLGGSMYCPVKGEIPTTTTLKVTPHGGTTTSTIVPSSTKAWNLSAAAGTKITVTGFADNSWCSVLFPDHTFDSETEQNTQVWSLRNGDTPPPFAPYGTQPNIDAFLKNYLDANGKVKLAENQVIYLFELFTTNTSDSTYDMQDLVVLATIVPKSN